MTEEVLKEGEVGLAPAIQENDTLEETEGATLPLGRPGSRFKRDEDGKVIQTEGDERAERVARLREMREGRDPSRKRLRVSGRSLKLRPGRPNNENLARVMEIEDPKLLVSEQFISQVQLEKLQAGRYDAKFAYVKKNYIRSMKSLEVLSKEKNISIALIRYKMLKDKENGYEWIRAKEAVMEGAVKLALMERAEALKEVVGLDLDLIAGGLRELKKLKDEGQLHLSIREIKMLTDILKELHHTERLELGKSTHNHDFTNMSTKDIEINVINVLADIRNNDFAVGWDGDGEEGVILPQENTVEPVKIENKANGSRTEGVY